MIHISTKFLHETVTHDLFQDYCEQTHMEITCFNVNLTVRIQQTK